MITTLTSKIDALTPSGIGRIDRELNSYAGLSTDTKPTEGVATGSLFIEVDTGAVFLYNEEDSEWVAQNSQGGA